jgi:hypothetical protein
MFMIVTVVATLSNYVKIGLKMIDCYQNMLPVFYWLSYGIICVLMVIIIY